MKDLGVGPGLGCWVLGVGTGVQTLHPTPYTLYPKCGGGDSPLRKNLSQVPTVIFRCKQITVDIDALRRARRRVGDCFFVECSTSQGGFNRCRTISLRRHARNAKARLLAPAVTVKQDVRSHANNREARSGMMHLDVSLAGAFQWFADPNLAQNLARLQRCGQQV